MATNDSTNFHPISPVFACARPPSAQGYRALHGAISSVIEKRKEKYAWQMDDGFGDSRMCGGAAWRGPSGCIEQILQRRRAEATVKAVEQLGAPGGWIRARRDDPVISCPLRFRHLAWKRLRRRMLQIARAWRRPDEHDALPAISDHLLRDIGISRLEATFMDFGSLPEAPPPDLGYAPRTSFSPA